MAKDTTVSAGSPIQVESRSNITGRSFFGKTEHQEKLKMSMALAESAAQLHDGKRPIYDFAKEETG